MQLSHLLGAGVVLASLGLFFSARDGAAPPAGGIQPQPAAADGHYVFVVEGDRDRLTIRHASHKSDPWAGVPKDFTSTWSLSIRDGNGSEIATVPLDMSKFDLSPRAKGKPLQAHGDIVVDARVAMLANVPCFENAATYTFLREQTEIGTVDAAAVLKLAGGGR